MNQGAVASNWSRRLAGPHAVRWLALFVVAGGALYLGAMVWSGWGLVWSALGRLGWMAFLAGAAVASLAYLIRFGRWHIALHLLGSRLPWSVDLNIYLSGLALTTSPGKVGETFRSVLLAPHGVPASRSLGVFLLDRLSDVLGVCLLGALAGAVRGGSANIAAGALACILAGSFVFRFTLRHAGRWPKLWARLPRWTQTPGRLLGEALHCWARLWNPLNVLLCSLVAAAAYGLQAGVFAWFCHLLGMQLGIAAAIEIFVNATLLGAASMVPGGLGAMEAAMVMQLVDHGVDNAQAVSAAIATRFATLWTGIFIGLSMLFALAASLQRTEQRP